MKKIAAVVVFAPMLFVNTSYGMMNLVEKINEEADKTASALKELTISTNINKSSQQKLQLLESTLKQAERLKLLYETFIGEALIEFKARNTKKVFDDLELLHAHIALDLYYAKGVLEERISEEKNKSSWCLIS